MFAAQACLLLAPRTMICALSTAYLLPQRSVTNLYILPAAGWRVVGVAMRCTACGAELILTNVVPDNTTGARGFEHHSFICSACHVTEHRVLFM